MRGGWAWGSHHIRYKIIVIRGHHPYSLCIFEDSVNLKYNLLKSPSQDPFDLIKFTVEN